MNDGYISLIGAWFLLLFLWIGLFDRFLRSNRWNKAIVAGWVILSLAGMGFTSDLWDGGKVAIGPMLLPLMSGIVLWIRQGERLRLHLLTASFLVGASAFLLRILLHMDPVLMIFDEKYMIAFFVAIIIMVAAKQIVHQWVLMAWGYTFGEVCFQFYIWEKTSHYILGSPFFRDMWWLTFYFLILGQLVLTYVKIPSFLKRKRAETTS